MMTCMSVFKHAQKHSPIRAASIHTCSPGDQGDPLHMKSQTSQLWWQPMLSLELPAMRRKGN